MRSTVYFFSFGVAIVTTLLVTFQYTYALPFTPGQTLDPGCTPGSVDCYIATSTVTFQNVITTNATSTNLFSSLFNTISGFFTNLTATNATTTNLYATSADIGTLIGTTLTNVTVNGISGLSSSNISDLSLKTVGNAADTTGTWTVTNDASQAWRGPPIYSVTFPNPLTPGSIIFVTTDGAYNLYGPPPTDTAGNTYRLLGTSSLGTGWTTLAIWYAYNASTTASDVITKYGLNWAVTHAIEITNTSGLPLAIEGFASNVGNSGTGGGQNMIGGTVTTTVGNTFILGWAGDQSVSSAIGAGTGYMGALPDSIGGISQQLMEYKTQATTGAVTPTWHDPTDSEVYAAITVAVSAGARHAVQAVDTNQMPLINFASPGHLGDTVNFGGQGGLTSQGNITISANAGNILILPTTGYSAYAPGGLVGIGTTSPTAQLHTTGTVRFQNFGAGTLTTDASGNLSVSSDERLKNIDGPFTRTLEDIMKIIPIMYHWNATSSLDQTSQYSGFSAQNMQTAIPEAVGSSSNGYLTLQDRPILATIVNALKEIGTITGAFRDALAEWLGSKDNRVGDVVAKRLCLADSEGSICITRAQLQAFFGSSANTGQLIIDQPVNSTSSQSTSSPETTATSSENDSIGSEPSATSTGSQ